jgi:hypothetical protein
MSLNAAKCSVLVIDMCGQRKGTWFVNSTPFLRYGDQHIPSMKADETYKYLGLKIAADRTKYDHVLVNVKTKLKKLTQSSLKPQQRLWALRNVVLPGLYYHLVLSDINLGFLKSVDKTIRKFVRGWLHIPHDVGLGFFHSGARLGGLAIPCLEV